MIKSYANSGNPREASLFDSSGTASLQLNGVEWSFRVYKLQDTRRQNKDGCNSMCLYSAYFK